MISFKEYLSEAKSNAAHISAKDNTAIATAGEHLVTHHLLTHAADNHPDQKHAEHLRNKAAEHLAAANKHLHGIDSGVVADAHGRAKAGADHFLKHHADAGTIHDVHHTAKAGDVTRVTGVKTNQTDDPADMVVHFKKKDGQDYHRGISYKHNKSNTLGTPGLGNIDSRFGTKLQAMHTEFQNSLKSKFGAETTANKAKRKELAASSPEANEMAKKFAEKAADHYHGAFNGASHEHKSAHLKELFKANSKIHTDTLKVKGTGGAYSSELHSHEDNKLHKAINDAHHFSSERVGSTVHYYAHDKDGKKTKLGFSEHRFTHGGFTSFGSPTHSAKIK
jgi:hypothetical protein